MHTLTLAEVNEEHTVYLVEVEDQDELAQWLAQNHQALFEEELNGWYTDPALWRRNRSMKMLRGVVFVELHSVMVDTGASSLELTDRIWVTVPEREADLLPHADWIKDEVLAVALDTDASAIEPIIVRA